MPEKFESILSIRMKEAMTKKHELTEAEELEHMKLDYAKRDQSVTHLLRQLGAWRRNHRNAFNANPHYDYNGDIEQVEKFLQKAIHFLGGPHENVTVPLGSDLEDEE